MEFQEFEGKSTEAAIELACAHFQVPPEKLEIEIVSVGSPGLFGLGSRKARIRAALREETRRKPVAPGPGDAGAASREDAGARQGYARTRRTTASALRIETEDAGLLIGKQGQTLDALQYLITKMLAKQSRRKVRIAIDVEAYRERHNESLAHMARKYGEKVKRSGKSITLNPMNPYDRRIVHLALQGDKDLKTMSRGEGLYKKVIISPAKKKEGQEDAPGPGMTQPDPADTIAAISTPLGAGGHRHRQALRPGSARHRPPYLPTPQTRRTGGGPTGSTWATSSTPGRSLWTKCSSPACRRPTPTPGKTWWRSTATPATGCSAASWT